MIEDDAVRNAIMEATYLYFKGALEGIDYDNLIQGLLGSASPNPAVNSTNISLTNLEKDYTIKVTDITGKTIKEETINAGTTNYVLNVDELSSGMYFYFLTDGINSTKAEKLNVIK